MQIKDAPIGSTVSLGGDSDKRRLIFGGVKYGMAQLFKTADDVKAGKYESMVILSHRVKDVEVIRA